MSDSTSPRGLQVDVHKAILLCLGGGAASGLITALVPWVLGWSQLLAALGIDPGSPAPWLSMVRYVGIRALWGLAFYPFLDGVRLNPSLTGFFVSLFFTAYQLLIGFPVVKRAGFLGRTYGWTGTLGVPGVNLVWGILAAFFIRVMLVKTGGGKSK